MANNSSISLGQNGNCIKTKCPKSPFFHFKKLKRKITSECLKGKTKTRSAIAITTGKVKLNKINYFVSNCNPFQSWL